MKAKTTSLRTPDISFSSRFISSGFSTIHILSTFSSHNVRELGIVFVCWQFTYSYEILKRFVNRHINVKVSRWSQIYFSYKSSFIVRNACALTLSLWSHVVENKKGEIKIFQMIYFSADYDILEPLFIHLWALSTAFVWMQVKTGFDTPIFNYNYPVYTKLKWYQLFTINTINELLKSFYFQRLVLWE